MAFFKGELPHVFLTINPITALVKVYSKECKDTKLI